MKQLLSKTLLGLAMLVSANFANAQFTATDAGPINSAGPVGNLFNTTISHNYAGPSVILTQLDFQGDLTSTGIGSFRGEARWNIRNVTAGGANSNFQFQTGNAWTGPDTINASRGIFAWANAGDTFAFEAFESFNDGGDAVDAIWTDVSFDFHTVASVTNIGSFGSSSTFDFDTATSSFDTELSLYTANGTLVETNDDATGLGLQSRLNMGTLAIGEYYLIQSGFNSLYFNGLAVAGAASGDLNVQLNGNTFFSGAHAGNTFTAFSFEVIPEPSSLLALAGVALVGLTTRRRRLV